MYGAVSVGETKATQTKARETGTSLWILASRNGELLHLTESTTNGISLIHCVIILGQNNPARRDVYIFQYK